MLFFFSLKTEKRIFVFFFFEAEDGMLDADVTGVQTCALPIWYRKRLTGQRTSEGQRLAKVLEDAGIKIDSVASKLLIKSGRAMIGALISGERDPARLADLAEGVLRRKTEELQMACDGRFTAGHGQMCRLHLDAYDHLTAKIAELDALVAEAT